ncbi:MAG TPA: bifunctional DNA-formamidopyrimidine glycosylase/DNA-(apurinic or apyrimidinic site) lyase [Solirubrobacteraceae bacterium]|nr:bifunctional DNA-formamidopyrimidine glycosylase/DNA-(apurinic or apyrimidinic site) lyase [Solirubrobacteraceae bacterium]
MPELPEVETIRRHLAPRLEGRRVQRLCIHDPRWCEPVAPSEVVAAVRGREIEALRRRGKYLDVALTDEVHLLLHLRMTGTLLYDPDPRPPVVRIDLALDDGHALAFVDPRRFGTGQLALGPEGLDAFFAARLGVEPLGDGFTADNLRALARSCRAPVKAMLLDQKRIAGVGNIYADEALFRARIHPLRPANRLTRAQTTALRDGVVDALRAGIAAGGATIDDYRDPDGARGAFQDQFLVHRREGEPCPRCGTPVVKLVAAGRGTYACPRCQPRPRVRARSKRPAHATSAAP